MPSIARMLSMRGVQDVIKPYGTPSTVLASKTVDREALRADLLALQSHVRRILWIAVGMTLTLFLFELVVAARYVESPGVLAGIAGAVGLTLAGGIESMRRLATEMARVNLLVGLSGALTAEHLSSLVNTLAVSLGSGASVSANANAGS